MKLSQKQKNEIYSCITNFMAELRSDLLRNYFPTMGVAKDKADFKIAQAVIPMTDAVIKTLEGEKS